MNAVITGSQYGFRSGRSRLSQLLARVDSILCGWLEGLDSDWIYSDFAKAFDKVDHALLIDKMKRLAVHPTFIRWIESFLSNRKQCVVIDGLKSREELIVSGVPQSSVLAPVLFNIFINDIESVVCAPNAGSFADDTKILKCIASVADHDVLQEALESIISWSKRNNMELI